jgi:hypothetical protein
MVRHARKASPFMLVILGTAAACACVVVLALASAEDSGTSAEQTQALRAHSTVKPDQHPGTVEFTVRDSETGYAVPATIKYANVEEGWASARSQQTDDSGRLRLELPAGEFLVEASAPGYRHSRSHISIKPSATLSTGFRLSPEKLPEEFRPERVDSESRPGFYFLHGFVVDDDSGKPILDAKVKVKKAQLATTTDARGYFSISVPVSPPAGSEDATDTLVVEFPEHKKYVFRNILLVPDSDLECTVSMERGPGVIERNEMPKVMRSPEQLKDSQSVEPGPPSAPLDPKIQEWLRGQGQAWLHGTDTSNAAHSLRVQNPAALVSETTATPQSL